MIEASTRGVGVGEEASEFRFSLIDLWMWGITRGVNIPSPSPVPPQGEVSLRRGKPRIES